MTRDDVLLALLTYGKPITAHDLAAKMQKSAQQVGNVLETLYNQGKIERRFLVGYMRRYEYMAKDKT